MKLATWNVNSLAIRLPHLLAWLAETQPDAVVLQETKLVDEKFPHAELKEDGKVTQLASHECAPDAACIIVRFQVGATKPGALSTRFPASCASLPRPPAPRTGVAPRGSPASRG